MRDERPRATSLETDVFIAGGGLAGVACALTAATLGRQVVLCEELDWLGGQVSSQGIPFDEFPWNETVAISRSYMGYRQRIRDYYLRNTPLTAQARERFPLNPGMGVVSSLCHDPRVSARVLEDMLMPMLLSGRIRLLRRHRVVAVHSVGDVVKGATIERVDSGARSEIEAGIVVDATETGELILLAGVEHVTGAEGRDDTGELHALDAADPLDQQGFNWAFAVDYLPGEDHTGDKPANYDFWRSYRNDYWPGPQLGFLGLDHFTHEPKQKPLFTGDTDEESLRDMWHFRRITYRRNFEAGFFPSDLTVFCNMQNEYHRKPLYGVDAASAAQALAEAKEVSLSLLYWLQTEAPRHDGGEGYRGLRLREDVFETDDGLAKQPYTREARRILPEFRLLEQHVGVDARPGARAAERFKDAIGVAAYRLNIHPTRTRDSIDVDCFPYQLPLGALLPRRVDNFIPACCKLIGTTRVTNSSVRHHPMDWVLGEAAGALAAQALKEQVAPRAVRGDAARLETLQRTLASLGVMLRWPEFSDMQATHAMAKTPGELTYRVHGPGASGS
jgi:hypothetical protein